MKMEVQASGQGANGVWLPSWFLTVSQQRLLRCRQGAGCVGVFGGGCWLPPPLCPDMHWANACWAWRALQVRACMAGFAGACVRGCVRGCGPLVTSHSTVVVFKQRFSIEGLNVGISSQVFYQQSSCVQLLRAAFVASFSGRRWLSGVR